MKIYIKSNKKTGIYYPGKEIAWLIMIILGCVTTFLEIKKQGITATSSIVLICTTALLIIAPMVVVIINKYF